MNARERSRIDTRTRLIRIGAELFAEKGVADTTAAEIARAAGVAVGTIYLHFGDKCGLLRAILFEGVEQLMAALKVQTEQPAADVAAGIRANTETMVHFAEARPAMCRILFDPEAVRTRISTEIIEHLVVMQESRIRQGVEMGQVDPSLDPVVASHAAVGMLIQVLDWWTRQPVRTDSETLINTLTQLRIAGLYHLPTRPENHKKAATL